MIFTRDKIIGRGYNKKIKGFSELFTLHAEYCALSNARDKYPDEVTGSFCLVIRLNKRGNLTNSMPCNNCIASLRAAGVKKVFYSVSGGEIKEMKL